MQLHLLIEDVPSDYFQKGFFKFQQKIKVILQKTKQVRLPPA